MSNPHERHQTADGRQLRLLHLQHRSILWRSWRRQVQVVRNDELSVAELAEPGL
jgi:hypothetical protein